MGGSGGAGGAIGGGGAGGQTTGLDLDKHTQEQVENEFNASSLQDTVLHAFQLVPVGGDVDVDQVRIELRDLKGSMVATDFSDLKLWQDNGDRIINNDTLVSTGSVQGNFLQFPLTITVSAATDYIVTMDVASIDSGDGVTFDLDRQDVTAHVAPNGPTIVVTGSAGNAQHER
jgi:hypothetical protein